MATDQLSQYLTYLPALFQEEAFLGRFLLAFEGVLTGLPATLQPLEPNQAPVAGFEAIITELSAYLDPMRAPEEFLPWLGSWVALSMNEQWDQDVRGQQLKRQFIQSAVSSYRLRGTKAGLQQLLMTYTQQPVTITDNFETPHYFEVEVTLSSDPNTLGREQQVVTFIINQQKPAHTYYGLKVRIPSMQLLSQALADELGKPPLRFGSSTMLLGTQAGG